MKSMKSLTNLSLLFLCIVQTTFAQKSISEVQTAYTKYFQDTRELPYLHLNKTSFLNGEEVWFKAYVLEQNSMKLHPTVSNLYVSVFKESGELIKQQLVHIQQGMGYGSILLDSTFTQKNYYLKASTQWMKNFNEDQSFSQKINIVTSKNNIKSLVKTEKDFFQLKLFPEGGHFTANAMNRIGILLKDSNNERLKAVDGVIKSSEGVVIKKFATNNLGLGNVALFLKEREPYTFEATLGNGTVITKKITASPSSKIALRVENKKNSLVVHVHTNLKYLQKNDNKQFKVWVHNTKKFFEYDLTLSAEMQNYALIIRKSSIPTGMNIVTVFDDKDTPIAERLVFINDKNLYTSFEVEVKEQKNDSIVVTFNNPTNEELFLSASFLPKHTKAYKPKNSIISSLLLQPHIKDQLDNDIYSNLAKGDISNKSLDLSLIASGWSKYNWNTILTQSPQLNHGFEQGIDMTFHLNKKLEKNQTLLIFSPENNLLHELSQKSIPFVIKNTSIKKDTEISFGLKKGDRMLEVTPFISYSNHQLYDTFENFEKSDVVNEIAVTNFPVLTPDVETLDEIVLKSKKTEIPLMSRHLRKIDIERITITSGTLLDYLRLKLPLNKRFLFFMNGEQQRGIFGYMLLTSTYVDEIKEMYIGSSLIEPRMKEVHVYTFSPAERIKKKTKYTSLKIPVGFTLEKEYYHPKYRRFSDHYFERYGAMFWEPNIVIQPNESVSITLATYRQKNVKIYIEGISKSGKLVSKQKTIELSP